MVPSLLSNNVHSILTISLDIYFVQLGGKGSNWLLLPFAIPLSRDRFVRQLFCSRWVFVGAMNVPWVGAMSFSVAAMEFASDTAAPACHQATYHSNKLIYLFLYFISIATS
jgi:hypothetical protein